MALSLAETDLKSGTVVFTSKPSSVRDFVSRQLPWVMLTDIARSQSDSTQLLSLSLSIVVHGVDQKISEWYQPLGIFP